MPATATLAELLAEASLDRLPRERKAGILLHPTSLPGGCGVGDLGSAAEAFLRWLAEAGQSVWQVLPLGPTGFGDSPYSLLSSFAGNPLLISLEELVKDGLLDASDLSAQPETDPERVDFAVAAPFKRELLGRAFEGLEAGRAPALAAELDSFRDTEGASWLDDWALFAALKDHFGGSAWPAWEPALAHRRPTALERSRESLSREVHYHCFVQLLFARQWRNLRRLASELGIEILGDLPIYTALDSADVWTAPGLWELDAAGRPLAVAGVPPDAFSEEGQLWGNPLYRWRAHREEDYAWWSRRLEASFKLADRVRIDHFRGFAGFWRVPAQARTAAAGRWVRGPGRELFEAVRKRLGRPLPLVAEDLGVITPDVRRLLAELGFPGMKVLQFAFTEPGSDHLPHRYQANQLVYTATHDNPPARAWFETASAAEAERVRAYLGLEAEAPVEWALIRTAYTSVADLAVVPLQDVLGLGEEARMNTPGREGRNWSWRLRAEQVEDGTALRLRRLAEVSDRLPAELR
ncbi:MAG: 4-alpha-glucanotransferase [Thermoanaerobaculia bacterium]